MADSPNPFVGALTEIFATMFGCELTVPDSQHDRLHSTRDVTGIIGLTGKVDGNVVLSLDCEVALSLTDAMLGQRPASIDEDVIDAVGETVNIVVGNAKARLESLQLTLGIPTVVTGAAQAIRFTGQADPVWYRFDSEWGKIDMCIALALAPTAAQQPVAVGVG
jgi:chemotaxis protein CheX